MERKPDLRPVAGCVAAGLFVLAATVFLRRIADDSLANLPAGEAAAYAAAFVFGGIWAARQLTDRLGASAARAGDVAALVVALGFVAGLTTAGVGVLACVVACLGVFGLMVLPRAERSAAASTLAPVAATDPAEVSPPEKHESVELGESAIGQEAGTTPALQLVRSTRHGRQVLKGQIRFEIPAGENVHVLHVPLWPPLDGDPVVTCELEEIEGRVRVPVAKPYGLRIEVRLPEPVDEPLEGAVRFVAEARAASAA